MHNTANAQKSVYKLTAKRSKLATSRLDEGGWLLAEDFDSITKTVKIG